MFLVLSFYLRYFILKLMVFIIDTDRMSSVNTSRLAREFTDDSIHQMPSHITKVVTLSNSVSRERLVEDSEQ